jgi:CheY-like chemotaxis protein
MQALGQVAGGVAHEFNNLLQAVQGAVELIDSRPDDLSRVRRCARVIRGASERGSTMTDHLLSFARRAHLHVERIELPGLMEELRDRLKRVLGTGIMLRPDIRSGLPPLMADKGQLEIALVNLARNARDAMPRGGTLTLSAGTETVAGAQALALRLPAGSYVRLVAADDGSGMDRHTLARATEPFFTTRPPGRGVGLGLSMVKGFAEQNGGALRIASEPGHGTEVTLWLPTVEAAASGGRPLPGRPILLVDDDEMVRETLAASLEDAGYSVLAAASGPEALALLASGEAVEAMVCDLAMPGMDGLALIRQAQARRPGLPVVLLTGHAGDAASIAVGGALTGSFSLLRKPALAAQLIERLEAVMRNAPMANVVRAKPDE